MFVIDILARWLHVTSAILAVGGAFFLRFILPLGINALDAEHRDGVLLRCRRGLKFVVHASILVLLLTGTYNASKNFAWYAPPVGHAFFGVHVLLALAVFSISLWLLAGREPRRGHKGWMKVNVVLMLLAVAAASALKWHRDGRMAKQAGPPERPWRSK